MDELFINAVVLIDSNHTHFRYDSGSLVKELGITWIVIVPATSIFTGYVKLYAV